METVGPASSRSARAPGARCCPSTVDVWLGGAGNYSNAAGWSLGVVPNNGNLVGGQAATFTVEIAGGLHNNSAVTLDMNATVDDLAIDATNSLTIAGGSTLTVAANTGPGSTAGAITNAGTIVMNAAGSNADLVVGGGGTLTLSGGGTIMMSNSLQNRIHGGSGSTLSNVDNTIVGAGQIFSLSQLNNQGTIIGNQTTGLQIQSGVATTDNTGTLEATGGGALVLDGTALTSEGTVQVDAGSAIGVRNYTEQSGLTTVAADGTFSTPGTYNQAGGTDDQLGGQSRPPASLRPPGSPSSTAASPRLRRTSAVRLPGNGTIVGDVSNSGTVTPGDSPGQLSIMGNYAQNSGGQLNIELGGTTPGPSGFDVLNLSGTATLDPGSILNVNLVNGFAPASNDTFLFMNYGSLTGTFTTLNGLQQGNLTFTVQYLDSQAVITAQLATTCHPPPRPRPATNVAAYHRHARRQRQPAGPAPRRVAFVYGTDPTLVGRARPRPPRRRSAGGTSSGGGGRRPDRPATGHDLLRPARRDRQPRARPSGAILHFTTVTAGNVHTLDVGTADNAAAWAITGAGERSAGVPDRRLD